MSTFTPLRRQSRSLVHFAFAVLACLGSSRAPAFGQTCPPADLAKWACDQNQGLLWFQEQPAEPPAAPGTGTEGDHLGISAAGWGDYNGDGNYDILFGGYQGKWEDIWGGTCPFPPTDSIGRDKAWIVLGNGTALCSPPQDPQPCNQFQYSVVIELRDYSVAGRNDRLGWRVVFLGNIDGHAGDEIVVSAPASDLPGAENDDRGSVYVISYRGGLPTAPDSADPETGIPGAKVLRIRAEAANDWLGFGLARGGQIIGDATYDLLIGAPSGPRSGPTADDPDHSGRVYVVDGSALAARFNAQQGGIDVLPVGGAADFLLDAEDPGQNCVRLKGNNDPTEGDIGMRFGYSVCAIGDTNDDGRNEFAVGAIESWWNCTLGIGGGLEFLAAPKGRGRVRVFEPVSGYTVNPVIDLVGTNEGDWFGYSLAGGVDSPIGTVPGDAGGDVGDPIPDLLIGAPLSEGNPASPDRDAGSAYLYSGANFTVLTAVHGDDPLEHAGWAVALGGKLNHDEFAEFAVVSRDFDVPDPLPPGSEPPCMDAVDAVGLWGRGDKHGRVRVYCGSPTPAPGYPLIAEIHGIQAREHIYAVVWLPNMENVPHDFTELLFTTPAFAACLEGGCNPISPVFVPDGRREIGRAYVRLFH